MFARKFLWVAGISLIVCVIVFALLTLSSRLYTSHVLAGWEQERQSLTGPLLTYPPQGEDVFNSAATVAFSLGCLGQGSPVTVEGPTTIQRQDPVRRTDDREEIEMEMVAMDLVGQVEMVTGMLPVRIRESPDRRSGGKATQIKPGEDFPATSFFDVYIQVDLGNEGDIVTLENRDPVAMRAIIDSIPPIWVEYIPPPDFVVYLYNKADGRFWGCMKHPKHVTLPPIIKLASVPDPGMHDIVELNIQIENPMSTAAIPIYAVDRLVAPTGMFLVQPGSLQADPGEVYLTDGDSRLVWENNADPGSLEPVVLQPRHRAAITFTAQIYAMDGSLLPNVLEVESPPLGLSAAQPMTLTTVVPGGQGNLTLSHKDAQPFVTVGDLLTYTIVLSNTGVNGPAHATLTDPIPPGTTYVPGSVGGGAYHDPGHNMIVLPETSIPPGEAHVVDFQVQVGLLAPDTCITNTATVIDNWSQPHSLSARTVIVDNTIPGLLNFEWQKNTFVVGSVAPVRVRVVDRQGLNVPDGTAVTLDSSGGTLVPPPGSTLLTHDGLVTGTLTSDIVQTVVVTAATSVDLAQTGEYRFYYGAYLPLVIRAWP